MWLAGLTPPSIEQGIIGAVTHGRGVVDERVVPDVDDALRREWQRNTPRLPGPADRDVFESALDEPQHLVATGFRRHERRVGRVVLEQCVAVLRQLEEEVLLRNPVGL